MNIKNIISGNISLLLLFSNIAFGTITSDLTNSDFGFWILGSTKPINGKTVAVPTGAPDEDFIIMDNASAFYWETLDGFDDEGSVTFWIYDSAIRLDGTQASGNGPYWGLRSTDLGQVLIAGVFRRSFTAGDLGYNVWSSVAPFSPHYFANSLRGSSGAHFNAGWYQWIVDGTFDNITFSIINVPICNAKECAGTSVTDKSKSFGPEFASGAWAGVFGFGWSALAFKGEADSHPENFYIQVTGGIGVFKDVAGGVGLIIKPTKTSSWGAIKKLY